ncbi:hypothetical protein D3C71_168710 [compost metagenome]
MNQIIKWRPVIYSLSLMTILFAHKASGQQGACTTGGAIGYSQYVNYTGATSGDQSISAAGSIEIGPAGVYDVYGALINNGNITVQSGGVLSVYGDFVNNGTLKVSPGGTINFYGNTWTNATTALVSDNEAMANTTPGGNVNFIAPRPAVPASYLSSSPCLSAYSSGNFAQNIDGGNVAMDISMHIKNANNVNLVNSNTRLEGALVFDAVSGDVNLGNNNFDFTANGTWSTTVAPDAAYFLTNGTTACAGAVEKTGLASGASFVFPIGRAETYSGGRDFTPAILRNDGTVTDNFQVRVKNYADAQSIGGIVIHAPEEGVDRVWQITSTNGSGVTMNLQHNSATNGGTYITVFGGDPNAFITQYQGNGNWNTGPSGTDITGSVGGSVIHVRGFSLTSTATNCGDAGSWFTKSPDANSPLPVTLLSFTGKPMACAAQLNWLTAEEQSLDRFEVEYSKDGSSYKQMGSISAKNIAGSTYEFSYEQPAGPGYYRLKMIDWDGQYAYSAVVLVHTNCDDLPIVLYPNPTPDVVHVKGLQIGSVIQVYDISGKQLIQQRAVADVANLELGAYAAGTYTVIITNGTERLLSVKVVKQ